MEATRTIRSSHLWSSVSFLVLSAIVVSGLYITTSYSYLLFHSIIELFAVVVAAAVFVIGWNALDESGYFRIIGTAYLFVGITDALHTLSYSGMGVFPGYDANLPTQLWILARYIEAFSLLIAPLIMERKIHRKYLLAFYAVLTSVFIGLIFLRLFPDAFIVGQGLTPFKILSEYVIIGMLAFAVFAYHSRRHRFDKSVLNFLYASIAFTIAAELSFTLYVDPYGFANMIGHYLRFVSYFFIYKAIVESSLIRPYEVMFRELKANKDTLAEANDLLELINKLIAHDIRHELSIMQLSIELYEESHNESLLTETAESITKCTQLITNALALSPALEAESKLVKVNIRDILLRAIENSRLRVTIEGNGIVLADANLLSVFRNIVKNAEIHSGSDSLDIVIQKKERNYEIRFSDQGVGIPDELRQHVFDEGFRSGNSKGLGLGLFIVKRLVERYKGTITVEPNLPRGTTFVVLIPAAS